MAITQNVNKLLAAVPLQKGNKLAWKGVIYILIFLLGWILSAIFSPTCWLFA